MGYNVIIFNFNGNPPDLNDIPKDFQAPIIGLKSEIRKKINSVFTSVVWSNLDYGYLEGEGFVIEFNLSSDQSHESIGLRITGNGDPYSAIIQLCKLNNWSAYDVSIGEWVDFTNPNKEGWKDWIQYKNQFLKTK